MGQSKNIFMEERLVSECCGANDKIAYDLGIPYSEISRCPKCKDFAKFVSESQREEEMRVEILTGKKDTNE